jgi:hypothetical protein
VLGGLTAIESAVEIVVFKLVCEPVRNEANAARRGRDALAVLGCGRRTSPLAVALLEMRAASWLRVGSRAALAPPLLRVFAVVVDEDEGAAAGFGTSVVTELGAVSGASVIVVDERGRALFGV